LAEEATGTEPHWARAETAGTASETTETMIRRRGHAPETRARHIRRHLSTDQEAVMAPNRIARIYGPANKLKQRDEVKDVLKELKNIEIDLEKYGIFITEVQTVPMAPGFNFFCEDPTGLIAACKASLGVHDQPKKLRTLRPCSKSDSDGSYDPELWDGARVRTAKSGLAQDNLHTASGKFMAANSKGKSFRQIGKGKALHLIIGLNGKCNAHLDTHGLVVGHDGHRSHYDFNATLEHALYDLLPDFVPGAFVTWGKQGWMAPMVRPEKDPDGNTKVVVGFFGHF